jgi:hypothetical protein
MTLLAVPSMLFYISAKPSFSSDLNSVIQALSLGNIGGSKLTCETGNSNPVINGTDYSSTIDLECSKGYLNTIKEFG